MEEAYRNKLSEAQYKVLREKATEAPYSGKYNLHFEAGIYACGACNTSLFSSIGKYDAGCGWPSFHEPINTDLIATKKDLSLGKERTEILCKNCGSHLGHIFNDGPSGSRYCVNSLSLDFNEKEV
jgi:peptide-methionine (R)-S-oxide reductase